MYMYMYIAPDSAVSTAAIGSGCSYVLLTYIPIYLHTYLSYGRGLPCFYRAQGDRLPIVVIWYSPLCSVMTILSYEPCNNY